MKKILSLILALTVLSFSASSVFATVSTVEDSEGYGDFINVETLPTMSYYASVVPVTNIGVAKLTTKPQVVSGLGAAFANSAEGNLANYDVYKLTIAVTNLGEIVNGYGTDWGPAYAGLYSAKIVFPTTGFVSSYVNPTSIAGGTLQRGQDGDLFNLLWAASDVQNPYPYFDNATFPTTPSYQENGSITLVLGVTLAKNDTLNVNGIQTVITYRNSSEGTNAANTNAATKSLQLGSAATYVTGISVSPSVLNLTEGDTGNLSASLTPTSPAPTNSTVNWNSSNDEVATVSNGVVTAVAAGTATITATAVGSEPGQPAVTAQCTVNVSAATTYVTAIDLSQNELALTLGSSSTLTADLTPSTPTDSTVTWTTSNPSVATVSNGTVLATGVGIATITATAVGSNPASSVSAQCTVTVTNPATGITIDGDKNKSIRIDEASITLTATVAPPATTDSIVWSSSDDTIASVNASTGVVTPVAKGTVTITATAGSVSDTCTLKVLGVATSPAIEEGVKAAEAYQKTKAGLTNLAGDPIDALQKNYKPALFSTSINEAAKRYFVRVTVTKEETHPTHDFEFSFAGQGINAEGDFQFVAIAKNSNYAIDSIELVVVDR